MKLGRTTSPPSERSVVLVVSPLVSLMIDQVSTLLQRGVPAGILSGNKGLLVIIVLATDSIIIISQLFEISSGV